MWWENWGDLGTTLMWDMVVVLALWQLFVFSGLIFRLINFCMISHWAQWGGKDDCWASSTAKGLWKSCWIMLSEGWKERKTLKCCYPCLEDPSAHRAYSLCVMNCETQRGKKKPQFTPCSLHISKTSLQKLLQNPQTYMGFKCLKDSIGLNNSIQ